MALTDDEVGRLFDEIDANHDGVIDARELVAAVQATHAGAKKTAKTKAKKKKGGAKR